MLRGALAAAVVYPLTACRGPVSAVAGGDASARRPTVHVVLLSGQSNSAGYGVVSDLTDQSLTEPHQTKILYRSNDFASGGFVDVAPIAENNLGEELALARLIPSVIPPGDKAVIVKVSRGGASLFGEFRSHEGAPYPVGTRWGGSGEWWQILESTWGQAMADLPALYPGHVIRPAFISWAQGEADCANQQATLYGARLGAFAADTRALVGELFFVVHQLDYRWGTLGGSVQADADTIRAAQAAFVAADPAAALIDNDDLPYVSRGHYGPDATMTKAGRSLAAYLASPNPWGSI